MARWNRLLAEPMSRTASSRVRMIGSRRGALGYGSSSIGYARFSVLQKKKSCRIPRQLFNRVCPLQRLAEEEAQRCRTMADGADTKLPFVEQVHLNDTASTPTARHATIAPPGGPATLPDAVVEFQQVVFCYDRTEVLHEVSFALHKGEIVGLLGPNGAGKSTTIKLITGILVPTAGSITVAGLPLPEKAIDVKQIIGYVPETAVLFDSLTGQEFLELSGRLHNVPEDTLQARIRDILETFGR